MDIQSIFYSLGTVFMILGIIILIGIAVLVFYIWRKIADMQKMIEVKINELAAMSARPIQKAANVAQSLLGGSKGTVAKKRSR